jgi:transposase-like protein
MVARAKEEVKQREKAIMQRLMAEERQLFLEEHPEDRGNGFYERTLLTSSGIIEDLRVPRTRSGEFYPAILPGKRRASVDLGDLVLLMFQCGISTRKIQQVLEGVYGAFYSHASIARLTQVAEEEIEAWRMRPLKRAYFSVIIDAVFLSLKRGSYKKEPVYIALGTDHEGEREILGFWVLGSEGESAQAWREILGELKERGVERVEIVVSDDLPGIEEATSSVFPGADHQLCITHAMRNSQRKVRRRDWEEVSQDLKAIYRAFSIKEAEEAFQAFQEAWKKRYPNLVRYWRENFASLTAFLKYPEQVRPYIYTTNQLERINKEIKRRTKTIEVFSSEESLISVLYLILRSENDKLSCRRLRGFRNLGWEEEG